VSHFNLTPNADETERALLGTGATRRIQFPEETGVVLDVGRRQAQDIAQNIPSVPPTVSSFSGGVPSSVIELVRQFQQRGFALETAARGEQISRATAPLPASLAGLELSGAQQLAFRRGEKAAVEPTIGGARRLIRETGSLVSTLERIQDDFQRNQDRLKADARWAISFADRAGSAGLDSLFNINPEVFAIAGLNDPQGYIDAKRLLEQPGNIALTNTKRTTLLGAGFLPGDIASIEFDVQNFGIDKVLEGAGITDVQRNAIKSAYGVVPVLDRERLATLFSIPDTNSKSGVLGFFGAGKTNAEKLDDLEDAVAQYRAAGFTDEQILKKMQ